MKPDYRDRKPTSKLDRADKAAREALKQFRHGTQITGGCAEIYAAVAAAIRSAETPAK